MESLYEKLDRLVDMKGNCDFIEDEMARLQLKTASKILEAFIGRPGVILGDDVGMGKTYVAIASAYYYLNEFPEKPVLIVVPSWMMRKKWVDDIRNFVEKNDKTGLLTEDDILMIEKNNTCDNLKQFIEGSSSKRVVVVPIDIFAAGSWKREKSFFLNCWFRHKRLRGQTCTKIIKQIVNDADMVSNPLKNKWMWTSYDKIPSWCYEILDKAYEEKDLSKERIEEGLERLRYAAMNALLPQFSVFVLDEAHKVKNPFTKKHQALNHMLRGKYTKTLFMTATPFQLSENELFSVLKLFENVDEAHESIIPEFKKDCELLNYAMQEFISCVNGFEKAWNYLRPDDVEDFKKLLDSNANVEKCSGDIEYSYRCYENSLKKKEELQAILSRFVIRNVKNKNIYRKEIIGSMLSDEKDSIILGSEHFIPFALWEKALYEIFNMKDRTFIPTVKQSLTSSYEALKASSVFNKSDLEALSTLKKMIPHFNLHPKLEELAKSVAKSFEKNEKTLVFCGRRETAIAMKRKLEKKRIKKQNTDIAELFKNRSEEAFHNYHRRFYNKQDISWYFLQENYIKSVLNEILDGKQHNIAAEKIAREVLESYSKYNKTKKSNLMFLKRIIEQIVIREALKLHKVNVEAYHENLQITVNNILSEEYVEFGLNLSEDEFEKDVDEENSFEIKNISLDMIKRIMDYEGIWTRYKSILNKMHPEDRDAAVSALIRFLQRDKSFFIELKKREISEPSKERSELISKVFSNKGKFNWSDSTKRFLNNYVKASKVEKENMLYGLRESSPVDIISGDVADSSRERIKEGFNTPFYPMVLISLPLAQEGIDLQKECRKVVHYDLEWNPASLEQRVGRIDRINSLISRLNPVGDAEIKLEIYYPYIKNTIDEAIYNTVKMREKWFSFILGGTPDWDSFSIGEDIKSLPEEICTRLQIDLSVK